MNGERTVALVGFMTAGKTTVGPQLAMRLGTEFVDLDSRLEAEQGETIADIFAGRGEDAFRQLEAELLDRLLSGAPRVLATGGGVVGREENRRRLSRESTVVWLDLRFETVVGRLAAEEGVRRPLVERLGVEGLRDLHHRRRPLYASCAHVRLDADRVAPGRLARRIALHLQRTVDV